MVGLIGSKGGSDIFGGVVPAWNAGIGNWLCRWIGLVSFRRVGAGQ